MLAHIGLSPLLARLAVEGFLNGLHKSPFHGFSVEFADHREYVAGDDLKYLDWHLDARTDHYYIKRFEEETNLRCYLLLDRSASMAFGTGLLTKGDYACFLASCLGYLVLRQQDACGLALFGAKPGMLVQPRCRRPHLRQMMKVMIDNPPSGGTDMPSSLRWLPLTQQRMARRIQGHQVLLFLLRAGFLTLLVLALARPIWSPTGTGAGLDRIGVLDISRSMGRRVEGRPTAWETARDVASQLIRKTLPGDRTAVRLTGSTTDVLAPWTNDGVLYLPSLSSLQSGPAETQLDSAFEPIRSLLAQRRPGVQVEIVFLTDNPANGWNTSEISTFAKEKNLPNKPGSRVPNRVAELVRVRTQVSRLRLPGGLVAIGG